MNSSIFFAEIPVQIGSNKMCVRVNEFKKKLICAEFLEIVMKKCKFNSKIIPNLLDSYAVFEYANGIERLVNNNENIIELWSQWKKEIMNNQRQFGCIKFIVRKYRACEKTIPITQHVKQQSIQKYYKKTKCVHNMEVQTAKKRKICDNPTETGNNNNNNVEVKNTKNSNNIFQFLFIKLKQNNNYKLLKNEKRYSDGSDDSCSIGEDVNSSKIHLKHFF